MSYKWLKLNASVRRLADGACIPNCADNLDWRAFQKWVADGGVPQAEDVPPPVDKDAEGRAAIDATVLKAKVISDLAFRFGVAPGALSPAQIATERNRIAAIYAAL